MRLLAYRAPGRLNLKRTVGAPSDRPHTKPPQGTPELPPAAYVPLFNPFCTVVAASWPSRTGTLALTGER